jgi:hypothetical protein
MILRAACKISTFFSKNHDERLDGCVFAKGLLESEKNFSYKTIPARDSRFFSTSFLVLVVEFQARSSSHFRDFAVGFIILGF